jgi:hypothetical protein
MIDVVRDEAIAVWEPAERAGRTRSLRTILVECFYEGSLEVRRPNSFALSLECLPTLPAADDGVDSVSCSIVARKGIREVVNR